VAGPDHNPDLHRDPASDPHGAQGPKPGPGSGTRPDADLPPAPIIDWSRTARRLRTILLVIGGTAAVSWLVLGLLGDGPTLQLLAELVGIGILLTFAVEVVVVGGVAIRGMFTAGARGDRLAGQDVFLLPPQLLRGQRRRGDPTDP
jgi:hypothetical protein